MRRKLIHLVLLSSALLVAGGCSGSSKSREVEQAGTGTGTGEAVTPEQLEEIQKVERAGRNSLVGCYREELERRGTKNLEGTLTLQIHIGTSGAADEVKIVSSTLDAPKVQECVKEVIRAWEFPVLRAPLWYGTTVQFKPQY